MLLSKLFGERLKEKPSEAFMESHVFLLRGGYIRQVGNGIFSLLPPAKKVISKIENIIREEMDGIDGQEVLFPVVLPADLWKESGRYGTVGDELVRFKDRNGHDMVLGMTHEEAAVHLARSEAKTYIKYPFMIYQIQTKFRDEPRARAGLIRVREFTMKDGYSFHRTEEDLDIYYNKVHETYHRIFTRAGLKNVVDILSDTGMMGGLSAHEFMYLSEHGEDSLVICENCGYKANMEVAQSAAVKSVPIEISGSLPVEVYTPDVKDIEALAKLLDVLPAQTIKTVVFEKEGSTVIVFIRGDMQVNEAKLKKILGTEDILPFTDYEKSSLCFGFIGPYGLNAKNISVIYDRSLEGCQGMVCGANKENFHMTGIDISRDLQIERFHDISKVTENDGCTCCGKPLKIKRGIEIGNIFELGDKYTRSMNMNYTDEDGSLRTPLMGCYGIGIGRLLSCIAEDNRDGYGIIWPKAVAPWQVHICMINSSAGEVKNTAYSLYEQLGESFEVILDDRDLSAGVQFADADLLGVPVRIIISGRNIKNGEVEIITRDKSYKNIVKIEDIKKETVKILL